MASAQAYRSTSETETEPAATTDEEPRSATNRDPAADATPLNAKKRRPSTRQRGCKLAERERRQRLMRKSSRELFRHLDESANISANDAMERRTAAAKAESVKAEKEDSKSEKSSHGEEKSSDKKSEISSNQEKPTAVRARRGSRRSGLSKTNEASLSPLTMMRQDLMLSESEEEEGEGDGAAKSDDKKAVERAKENLLEKMGCVETKVKQQPESESPKSEERTEKEKSVPSSGQVATAIHASAASSHASVIESKSPKSSSEENKREVASPSVAATENSPSNVENTSSNVPKDRKKIESKNEKSEHKKKKKKKSKRGSNTGSFHIVYQGD